MKAKNFFILSVLTLSLSACFSPWQGDVGTFTISFGGGSRVTANVSDDGGNNAGGSGNGENSNKPSPMETFYSFLENHYINHTIKLSGGPGPDQIKENVYYKQNANFSVTPGRWDISVEAWIDLDIFLVVVMKDGDEEQEQVEFDDMSEYDDYSDCIDKANRKILIAVNYSPKSIDIKPGQNGSISIEMNFSKLISDLINGDGPFGGQENSNRFEVSDQDSWDLARNIIKNYTENSNTEYFINITGEVSISSSSNETFGTRKDITVTINGVNDYSSISLSSSEKGSLLVIGLDQTVIVQDIKLKSPSNNVSPVVIVNGGSFIMKNDSSVSGNFIDTNNGYDGGNGGGVYVNGGTFTMESGSSVYGNTAYGNGGGVYVNGGTFIMKDNSSVAGNTAKYGGGVYVGADGTFVKNGGTIYGEDDGDDRNKLSNEDPCGFAVYVQLSGDVDEPTRPERIRNKTADDSIELDSESDKNWENK